MTDGANTLSLAAALLGGLAIWVAYGGALRGWLSTTRGVYVGLSVGGAVLVIIGLGTSIGVAPAAALAAGLAIALTAAILVFIL